MTANETGDAPETTQTRTGFDRSHSAEYQELAEELDQSVAGEVQFDQYARVLYSTDGSIYQAEPAGVVHPRNIDDVVETVAIASSHDVPILPRGAGSSLAGQTVGRGCIVLDFTTYMNDCLDVNAVNKRARVQPGIVQDDLDRELANHGLKFAPDPASSNRATIGGGIGNNSTGAHSVRYGITDAYTEELQVVLSNGDIIQTREIVLDSPEWNDIVEKDDREAAIYQTVRSLVNEHEGEIATRYPDLKRKVSGYNLDRVIYESENGEDVINLSKLIVGAEGTLGVIVEATLSLVTVPEETALALYFFEDLVDAMTAVSRCLEHDVSAVELMDDEVFRLAAESDGYAQYVDVIPEDTAAALMVEFDSELVDDFSAAIEQLSGTLLADGNAFDVVEAYTQEEQDRIWKLRKAAIPLLMGLKGDPKPYPFIEDATVPPEELAEYVQGFEKILEQHGTTAAYFAHAGSGTLHIRPILNLKADEGIQTMRSITDDVTDLVLAHKGAFSGEHGDGMARTEFNPKMFGDELWQAFKEIKTAFDPQWRCNPGNVVFRDGPADIGPENTRGVGADMRENLRYGAAYETLQPQTTLDFEAEGGFSHLVELCNGCGTCRQTGSDVMCPTYRASREEIQTTRGRANMLRAAISGHIDPDELYSDRFQQDVLGLCVGCKGCKNDCPTGVDLAKLKAEVKHWHHQENGTGVRDRLFRDIDRYSALGSKMAPIANAMTKLPGSRLVMAKTLGIARDRPLPTFTRQSLENWFVQRGGSHIEEAEATDSVVLFPDTFTNYCYPGPGRAAVQVLEAANIHITMPSGLAPSGRAAFSTGFLDVAGERARTNVDLLAPLVADGKSIVFIEPSDAVMFQDEYLDLLDGDDVEAVSAAAYGIFEYLDHDDIVEQFGLPDQESILTYHGHCNQKAMNTAHCGKSVLEAAGYTVDMVDSTCCGMAGSFGYEAEHYELSRAIGDILFEQVTESDGDSVTAPGASCRSQLSLMDGERPAHPIEKIAAALST